MADSLYELLAPHSSAHASSPIAPSIDDKVTAKYLARLSTLPLSSITSTEPQSLAQSYHTNERSLQRLAARSDSPIVASSGHLSNLSEKLPQLVAAADSLRSNVPKLDEEAVSFSAAYSRGSENEVLERRKLALLMARNVDRISDILDLPTLLSSTITSSTAQGISNPNNYASALDLHSHIKRLHLLLPTSDVIASIYKQTEDAMEDMTSNLIASLRSQHIKLAAGLRTIGWLRRIAPELDGSGMAKEGSLGALFLVCRLATLVMMLSALEPLRDLADQETALRERDSRNGTLNLKKDAWAHGQQTERYLKRYVEIFREQSFAIVSMYRSIFPSASDAPQNDDIVTRMTSLGLKSAPALQIHRAKQGDDPLNPLPSALATFPLHLVTLLSSTLQQYLPNMRDKSSRESLLTQVLYCAGSLGRLGGDFSMLLASMNAGGDYDDESDYEDTEWISVMKKHRALASKLEKMTSGAT